MIEAARALLRGLRDRWDPELRRRRAVHFALNRDLPTGSFTLRQGIEFRVDPESRDSMEYFAIRSKEMSREMDTFLAATERRTRLLDIGALHGVFSLAFTSSRTNAKALAVEPSSEARAILQRNVELNPGLAIEVSDSALGRGSGVIRMKRNWQHLEALGADESSPDALVVAVESADELCNRLDFQPDVLKIDVEGFEGEILAGAGTLLAARPLILLELHPRTLPTFATTASSLIELLRSWNYRVDPISLRRLPNEEQMRRRNSLRVLAVPRETSRA